MEVFHQSVLVSQLDLLGQHRLEPVPAEASVLFAVSAELLFCCVPYPPAHPCQPGFSALIFYAANHLFVGKALRRQKISPTTPIRGRSSFLMGMLRKDSLIRRRAVFRSSIRSLWRTPGRDMISPSVSRDS